MATRHELTGQALDLAMAGKPEPAAAWRELLPPDDLGEMDGGGSANIPLFALVAALKFGSRAWAVRVATLYATRCRTRFMLAEPWSRKYGRAIVVAWAAAVKFARAMGEAELAALFLELLKAFMGTCALMAARLTEAPAGASLWERKRVGSLVVAMPGCRSWGLTGLLDGGFDDVFHIGLGLAHAQPRGRPGDLDDWGWVARVLEAVTPVLREAAQDFRGDLSPAELLARIPRWAARESYVLYGWEDGSRLATMGADEEERVDEDDNGNTPGSLLKGILGGRFVALPFFPDPHSGETKIRQDAVEADIDGSPERGWTLWHSKLGAERHPSGRGWLSRVAPYTASRLHFAIRIPAGSLDWVDLLRSSSPAPAPPAPPLPSPAPRPAPPRRGSRGGCAGILAAAAVLLGALAAFGGVFP